VEVKEPRQDGVPKPGETVNQAEASPVDALTAPNQTQTQTQLQSQSPAPLVAIAAAPGPEISHAVRENSLRRVPLRLAGASTTEPGVSPRCKAGDAEAAEFHVRGLGYSKKKKKVASDSSLYRLIGVDLLQNKFDKITKVSNVAKFMRFPETDIPEYGAGARCPLPRIFVANIQVPLQSPKMFGKPEPEAGISLVQYYELKPEAYREAMDLENASSAVKLLSRFFNEAHFNDDLARRFKVLGTIANISELGVPSMFHSYCGKPAIIFKTGQIFRGTVDGTNDPYFEMDVNVHEFAYVPRKAIYSVMDRVAAMKIRCAFMLQGESDEELPERVFACCAIDDLDISRPVPVDFHPPDSSLIEKRFTIN